MADQEHKPHRKGKEKKSKDNRGSNPKANTFAHPGRFQKQNARSHDVKEKRYHVPLVDRIPEEAPPLVVGVVGPPKVGKTTLIKSLIRRYTKQTISNPTGPLTVVTSKRRRLTFLECPADSLASMIDVAKVVDIVLLMIDGYYGFEMETMEFLNVLSSSGMPGNVFGILTKLDLFKKQDALRTRKKQLKHRFWSELYQGAKLFYLSGVVNNRYPDREVLNLSRFLSVMKNPRPLVWRNSHPYTLVDRILDMTRPTDVEQNSKCDRTVAFYGYVRGTNFPAQDCQVHIPGLGDLKVSEIEAQPDPCPTPRMDQAFARATGKTPRKRLGEKQKVLYAPMSDVGGVLMDKDAVYIDVKNPTFDREGVNVQEMGFGEQMVMGLQGNRKLLGQDETGVRLFGNQRSLDEDGLEDGNQLARNRRPLESDLTADGEPIDVGDQTDEADVSGDASNDDGGDMISEEPSMQGGSSLRKNVKPWSGAAGGSSDDEADLAFEDRGSDEDADLDDGEEGVLEDDGEQDGIEDGTLDWKDNLTEKARALHENEVPQRTADLSRLMYNLGISPADAVNQWNGRAKIVQKHDAEEFFTKKFDPTTGVDAEDRSIPQYDYQSLEQKWANPENLQRLKNRFTYTRISRDGEESDAFDGEQELSNIEDDGTGDGTDEGDGAFEDLEAANGQNSPSQAEDSIEAEREKNARKKEELKQRFEEEDPEGFATDKLKDDPAVERGREGDEDWYDAEKAKILKQLDVNRAEFEQMDEIARIRVEGFRAGTYAKIILENVPCEFVANFNPRIPILLGGLNPTETRFGFLQVRIKRHRWHQKILKNNDPLVFSLGWRRFQTLPVYSISDSRTRNRMLKYTPEHMHCFGTFYGPLVAPNTGFCCVQSFSNKSSGFRIAATGVVLSVDESTEIVKKLKIKGYPHKVYKNTAILRDMFASELEVMKFKSGNIKTVSGIRGMIKGRAGNQYPEGYVRAGFEDKILKSDIVFLSTWTFVKPREFYMPVTNLLMAPGNDEDQPTWQGVRTVGQIRYEENLSVPQDRDSSYRPIERAERHFNPLRVPRKLAADLPFKSQISQMKPQKRETYMQQRAVVLGGEEKRARDLMQKLTTLRKEKVTKRQAAQEKRREPHRKRVAEGLEKKAEREKREKEAYWRKEGKKRAKQDEGGGGGGKRRKK